MAPLRAALFVALALLAATSSALLPLKQRIGNSERLGLDEAVPSPPAELAALSCRRLVAWYTQRASGNPLLKDLPAALVSAFTLGGRMRLERFIVDDTNGGKGSHYKHPRAHMEAAMVKARAQLKAARDAADSLGMDTATPLLLQPAGSAGDGPLQLGAHVSAVAAASASAETLKMLRVQDRAYVAALAMLLEVEGKHALVFGSVEPWHETLLMAAGAASVTTLEYNRLTYDYPGIETRTPPEFVPRPGGYDIAISASSFDHDGLGRYGDPLDANADIKAMRLSRCLVRPGGRLLLTIPVGPDVVAYNLHRRYGRLRLPLMLQGWTVEAVADWDQGRLDAEADYRKSYEPLFVLRHPGAPSAARARDEL